MNACVSEYRCLSKLDSDTFWQSYFHSLDKHIFLKQRAQHTGTYRRKAKKAHVHTRTLSHSHILTTVAKRINNKSGFQPKMKSTQRREKKNEQTRKTTISFRQNEIAEQYTHTNKRQTHTQYTHSIVMANTHHWGQQNKERMMTSTKMH